MLSIPYYKKLMMHVHNVNKIDVTQNKKLCLHASN